jgi:hypothetical protein
VQRQDARLQLFLEAFEAGTEATFYAHTAELRAKEQLRLHHSARALKPLLLELEEDAQGGRASAAGAAAAAERRRRELQQRTKALRDTPAERLKQAQAEAQAAAFEAQATHITSLKARAFLSFSNSFSVAVFCHFPSLFLVFFFKC